MVLCLPDGLHGRCRGSQKGDGPGVVDKETESHALRTIHGWEYLSAVDEGSVVDAQSIPEQVNTESKGSST